MEGLSKHLWFYTSQLNGHSDAWTLLHTCRRSRQAILHHLSQITKVLLAQRPYPDSPVPKWLNCAFFMDECNMPSLSRHIMSNMPRIDSFVPQGIVAGGCMTRMAFEKEWKSKDVNVFVPGVSNERVQEDVYDIISRVDYPHVLERFDISVCQVGYDMKRKHVLCTPLFVYSFRTQHMIIQVDDIRSTYDSAFSREKSDMSLKREFWGWCCFSGKQSWSASTFLTHLAYHKPFQPWINRARKYIERFTEMTPQLIQ